MDTLQFHTQLKQSLSWIKDPVAAEQFRIYAEKLFQKIQFEFTDPIQTKIYLDQQIEQTLFQAEMYHKENPSYPWEQEVSQALFLLRVKNLIK